MAWVGWFEYAGVEIINATRTEAYAKGAGWFKPVYKADDLGPLFEEQYDSPLQDDAPWTDPNNLDTYDFWGCYPLDVAGVENSTATATIIESTLDGGLVGRPRRSTKAVVFNLALVGGSECAVEAGFRWLKATMSGPPCGKAEGASCQGYDLCYLACEPCVDWSRNCEGGLVGCINRYMRSLHRVAPVTGPIITAKSEMTDGGAVWIVAMTLVAGNPFEYGSETPVVRGFMRADNPYVPSIDNGDFDDQGSIYDEVKCPAHTFQPINDPLCPQLVLPPPVPQNEDIALACFKTDINYRRRQFTIPADLIPLWGDVVPYIEIHAPNVDLRNLRLRFYPDPLSRGNPNRDPCAFCGDIVFSYIPAGTTLVFDGTDEQVYVARGGVQRARADTVVFASNGGPFEWPQLTCGYDYIVTWDLPQSQDHLPGIDLSLYPRVV